MNLLKDGSYFSAKNSEMPSFTVANTSNRAESVGLTELQNEGENNEKGIVEKQ